MRFNRSESTSRGAGVHIVAGFLVVDLACNSGSGAVEDGGGSVCCRACRHRRSTPEECASNASRDAFRGACKYSSIDRNGDGTNTSNIV